MNRTRRNWTDKEDALLRNSVQKAGAVGTRYGDQCSSHWLHVLNPNINYSDWTTEEDQQLLDAVQTHGTNWSTISSFHTPKRTPLALKNQYWKLRQRKRSASKTAATVTSTSPPSGAVHAAENTASSVPIKPATNDDMAEGDDDEEEDIDVDLQSDEGDTFGRGKDIRASCPAEYAEADAGSSEWMEEWASFSMPQHMLGSSKEPESRGSLWTDLNHNSTSVLSQPTDTTAPQHPATDLSQEDTLFSMLDELQSFQAQSHLEETSIAALLTPVSTAASLASCAVLHSTQSKPGPTGKETSSCVSSGNPDAALAGAQAGWPDEVRKRLKSVSVKFSCPAEQVSNIMTLVAGTGLNATIRIDSEEVPVVG
ncbi:hypothetical protein N0V82_003004 [Gnomoniopsis sp. IMI 355080]|nr:hypothetical protein N0V82_003004 [Gnomoniopsis sp. IMI 355080]